MPQFVLAALLFSLLIPCGTQGAESRAAGESRGVKVTPLEGKVRVEINGQLFTEYRHNDGPHLFYFPLMGPGNIEMTRRYPMEKVENEDHDHPHHRSVWFSHGDVNGHDFWAEGPKSGKIVHQKFAGVKSGPDFGSVRSENSWIAKDGTVVCTDETLFQVYNVPQGRIFDFEIRLKASHGELKFGDTKEGTMAIRLAESMKVKGHAGENQIMTSEGAKDDQAWGKRAKWCDYSGMVKGKKVGVAIFDHPDNPRHPTWWHVRDYGLFAANPFGQHDFEKKTAGAGDLLVPAGQSVLFRYRFYLHDGDDKQGKVEEHYRSYAEGKLAPAISK